MVMYQSETERKDHGGKLLAAGIAGGLLALLMRPRGSGAPGTGGTTITGTPANTITYPNPVPGAPPSTAVIGPLPGAGGVCSAPNMSGSVLVSGQLSVSQAVAAPTDTVQATITGLSPDVERTEIWAGGSPGPSILPRDTDYRRVGIGAAAISPSTFPGAGALFIFAILYKGGQPIVTGMPSCPGFSQSLVQIVVVGAGAGGAAGGGGVSGGLGSGAIGGLGPGRSRGIGGAPLPVVPPPAAVAPPTAAPTPAPAPTPVATPAPVAPAPASGTRDLGWPNVLIDGVPYVFSSADRVNAAITFRLASTPPGLPTTRYITYGPGTLPAALSKYLAYFQ